MNDAIHLNDLHVLALDCQATGANPEKGRLLEIGWIVGMAALTSGPEPVSAESHLVRLRPGEAIPPFVQRVTGITDASMVGAVSEKVAWGRLRRTAVHYAQRNRSAACATIIHFARFEVPFLRRLHEVVDGGDAAFPFQIICTHQIATRLIPELPRRGIRALAGYLGHSLPERRRSADHALATLAIWKGLVALLQTRHDINNLNQLLRWLSTSTRPGRTKRVYPMNPGIRLALPDRPGIYRMRRSNADILYIGKARSLKQRVNSYFRSRAGHPEHILEMLSQARDVDVVPTESALEAAVLESDEIKRHCPPYNKALRPDQRGLVFFSEDLKQFASRCDQRFRIGPFPAGRMAEALSAFGYLLTQGTVPQPDMLSGLADRLLALPASQVPDRRCFAEGMALFGSRHGRELQHRSSLRCVAGLGAQLRRRQLESQAASQLEASQQTENEIKAAITAEATQDKPAWTPERVADAIERMLMHWALLIRRARWYGLLSEACLAWTRTPPPEGTIHLVAFENTRIGYRDSLPEGRSIPVPAGFRRRWQERRKNFDLAAYDRMRVATTELRRLVVRKGEIQLRLGPKVSLNATRLEKILPWV